MTANQRVCMYCRHTDGARRPLAQWCNCHCHNMHARSRRLERVQIALGTALNIAGTAIAFGVVGYIATKAAS